MNNIVLLLWVVFWVVFACILIYCVIDDSIKAKKSKLRFLKRCRAEGLTIPRGTIVWLVNEEQLWIDRGKIYGYTFHLDDPRYEIRFLDRNSELVLRRFDSPFLFTNKNEAVKKLNSMRINKGKNTITENDII